MLNSLGKLLLLEMFGHIDFVEVNRIPKMTKTRFHDLRHSYAVNALQAGDSAKIVSEQLGHYSAAFTLDTYAAVSKTMRKESQEHMEQLFQAVTGLA